MGDKEALNASREGVNDDGEVLNGDRMMSICNGKAVSDDKKR